MSKSKSFSPVIVITHLLLMLGAFMMVVPFAWMILTSLKSLGEATLVPPIIFPRFFQWQNYVEIFNTLPFVAFYTNTVITTVAKTFGQLVFCSLAAYAFARIEFPGKNIIFIILLSGLMVPMQTYLIPLYLIMVKMQWLNTLTALIVPGITSIFGTFLLRQFFMSLPRELEDAAKIDGCNHFMIYYRILLPLAKPGLISLAILTALWSWNDFLWPLIVNSSPNKMTLSAGLASLQGEYATDYPLLMAGSVLATAPMLLLFVFLQRQFVEGIALSATKG